MSEQAWPEGLETRKSYRRYEDMSPDGTLSIFIEEDGDVIVDAQGYCGITGKPVRCCVQFCTLGGGGRSHHTRRALLALAQAIEKDNLEQPQVRR